MTWLKGDLSGADFIEDFELRKRITTEARLRIQRTVAVRWTGHLAFFLVLSISYWAFARFGGGFQVVGWGWILLLAGCVGLAAGLLELFLQRILRRRQEQALWKVMSEHGIPICVHCGYSLAGTVEPRCPECGAVSEPVRK